MLNEMASCDSQLVPSVLSRRCYSRRTNMVVDGWRLIGRGILYLLLTWECCVTLVLAKSEFVSTNNHAVTAVVAKEPKVDLRVEGKSSPSHKLRHDVFKFQPEKSIGALAANSKMKFAAASKDFRDLELWEDAFELEHDKHGAAKDLRSISSTDSKVSQHQRSRENGIDIGRDDENESVTSATSDLKAERSFVRKASQNLRSAEDLFELRPEDFDKAVASDLKVKSETATYTSLNRGAVEDAIQLRVKSNLEEEEEAGSNTSKDTFIIGRRKKKGSGGPYANGESSSTASAVYQPGRDEEKDPLHEELGRISKGSTATQRQGLRRSKIENGSQQEHRRVKNDADINSTTAHGKYNVASTSKVNFSISAPGVTADAVQSSDSDQLSKGKSDDAAARLQELEPEEADEKTEEKDLIAEYSLGEPITNWDRERQQWLENHPEVKAYTDDGRMRLLILTGTQPWPCLNEAGDHLLLRCFKNKVDYCRIHGIDIFYNMALLHPGMPTFWAKLPVVRATMLSHPEIEWIWWLDADAVITDMEFEIPLEKYEDYNMVVHGWESLVFEKKSWVSLNAGSFLMRNCQWSMDILERWASMGPQAPLGEAYKDILSDKLTDRPRNPTDDQAALVYLINAEKERWAGKIKVELEYFLNGYFVEFIEGFEAWEQKYRKMEKEEEELMEMVAQGEVGKERLVKKLGRVRQKKVGNWGLRERRPFVTHFTGCQPCSGHHNPIYSKEQCHDGMLRALNYGDDQVMRSLGFRHRALHLPDLLPYY